MSVSVLVRNFLERLASCAGRSGGPEHQSSESALDRRRTRFEAVFADFDTRGVGLCMADNLPREALYDSAGTHSEGGPARRPNTDG